MLRGCGKHSGPARKSLEVPWYMVSPQPFIIPTKGKQDPGSCPHTDLSAALLLLPFPSEAPYHVPTKLIHLLHKVDEGPRRME